MRNLAKFSVVLWLILYSLAALADQPASGIVSQTVTYTHDGVTMQGYLAYDPQQDGPRPGVLIVHEWWGHDEHVRDRARRLAEAGYVALALDMYGDGALADHPRTAQEFASTVRGNRDLMLGRFQAAKAVLQDHERTAGQPLVGIGYCFGGSVVLEAARSGMDLAMVASFHGALNTAHPAQAGEVQADILVFNGAADPLVSAEQIANFRTEMAAAGVDFTFVDFANATHSFTNPRADAIAEQFGMPVGYDPRADQLSWQWLMAYLEGNL